MKYSLACSLLLTSFLAASPLPVEMEKIMHQSKYEHSIWGIYVKDTQTEAVLFDYNSEKLFSPASTTKLFSVAALLDEFGDEFRFKTPVFASGKIENGRLQGNLILVAQGDLTMGGRWSSPDKISYTKMDHIIANEIPGVILTKEDPLHGLNELARQISQKGIREINGDVVIDDRLFETTKKRGMTISPIMINENLIDIVITPEVLSGQANVTWRPKLPGYEVVSRVKTVPKREPLRINVTSDESGRRIVVEGEIPVDQRGVVRTLAIQDPKAFARAAFIQALQQQGIKVNGNKVESSNARQQVALLTSPPLSEYAKLILKVSHNLGADLVPLLLASHQGKKTFDEGMKILGKFALQAVKLSPNDFVFIDAAGGNENRLTPQAEVKLLEYMRKQKHFFDALPILGVDGSLEDFAKKTEGAGKVRAKPGTGVAFNTATGNNFLITQAYAGYIEGKNGHLFAYIVVVNNAALPTVQDVFAIFEDEGQLSSAIYNHTN